MSKVLVTGMSATGKSSVLELLATRGHEVVDTDDDAWCRWVLDAEGRPDWVWREEVVAALLDAPRTRHLFVAGCKTNQGALYPRFDAVVLLSAPESVLLGRLAVRTTNPYGSSPEDRARILSDLDQVEPRLRATASAELDATAPLAEVADALEAIADGARAT